MSALVLYLMALGALLAILGIAVAVISLAEREPDWVKPFVLGLTSVLIGGGMVALGGYALGIQILVECSAG